MDDINSIINQYVLRSGAPYLSPAHTMTAENGPFGVPYWMQGIAMQTTSNFYGSAPAPNIASTITHQTNVLYTAGQHPFGTAPTAGIYTGVEDGCK